MDSPPAIVTLCSLLAADGQAHYAYVAVPAERFAAFSAARMAGAVSLEEYGSILLTGVGAEPGAEVREMAELLWEVRHEGAPVIV